MILKKPYAFLIKHFQKIHILLLVLSAYLFYKNSQFSTFVADYLSLGTYSSTLDSVSLYASILFYFVIIVTLLICGIMILLLRYKKKPYRFYIFMILEYLFLLGIFLYANSFFNSINGSVKITTVLAIRDLLFIATLPQYIIFVILAIRAIGVDLSKFGFEEDEKYLQINDEDNEEFEFELQIDKGKYKRIVKKKLRYLRYFYQEQKKVLKTLGIICGALIFIYINYYFNFSHKIYKEQETFSSNYYQIKVNNSYITDKDNSGKLILGEKSKKMFVILDITVKNLANDRTINVDRFHLMSETSSFEPILKYNQSFTDLGTPYEKKKLLSQDEKSFLLIYQVDKSLLGKQFVLGYQSFDSKEALSLKKVKLNVQDISKIEKDSVKKTDEKIVFSFKNGKQMDVVFNSYEFSPSFLYYYESCYLNDCPIVEGSLQASAEKTLLKITFGSSSFDGRELVDFSIEYGTIIYVDNNGKENRVKLEKLIKNRYQGNEMFFSLPKEIENSKSIIFSYVIRNKEYRYQLR